MNNQLKITLSFFFFFFNFCFLTSLTFLPFNQDSIKIRSDSIRFNQIKRKISFFFELGFCFSLSLSLAFFLNLFGTNRHLSRKGTKKPKSQMFFLLLLHSNVFIREWLVIFKCIKNLSSSSSLFDTITYSLSLSSSSSSSSFVILVFCTFLKKEMSNFKKNF